MLGIIAVVMSASSVSSWIRVVANKHASSAGSQQSYVRVQACTHAGRWFVLSWGPRCLWEPPYITTVEKTTTLSFSAYTLSPLSLCSISLNSRQCGKNNESCFLHSLTFTAGAAKRIWCHRDSCNSMRKGATQQCWQIPICWMILWTESKRRCVRGDCRLMQYTVYIEQWRGT